MKVCAGCGIKENHDEGIKLKLCTACKSVRYCSVKCQKEHRPKHKKACKKRAAELRDELLFKQPESSHLGDCPICFLPLPLEKEGSEIFCCCCKYVCIGCCCVYSKLESEASSKCPFCRKSTNYLSDEQVRRNYERRAMANDPIAIHVLGNTLLSKRDFCGAFELISRSAKLGCAAATYDLALMYRNGEGVEKDEKKMVRSFEDAAISGHPIARLALAEIDFSRNRIERSIKHFIIACKLGEVHSVKMLKILYKEGRMSKEEFEAAMSGHQAALEAMKSKEREEAEVLRKLEEKWGES